jgi:hypothetical protein
LTGVLFREGEDAHILNNTDHHHIETALFDGALSPHGGTLAPRSDVVGHGLTFRTPDAARYRLA